MLCAGMVAATIANVNRGSDDDPFTALDFIGESQEPTEEEKLAAFQNLLSSIKPPEKQNE